MPELSPLFLPVAELVRRYRTRELSPVEVTAEALERIEELNPRLNAFIAVSSESALEQARVAQSLYAEGGSLPPLLGVPTAIKDLFDVRGMPTSLGSLVYRGEVAEED